MEYQQQNIVPIVEIRYLDAEQNLLTREQLEEQRRVEESYCEEFDSYDNLDVAKSFGPGNNQSLARKMRETRNNTDACFINVVNDISKDTKETAVGFEEEGRKGGDWTLFERKGCAGARAGLGGLIADAEYRQTIARLGEEGEGITFLSNTALVEAGVGLGGVMARIEANTDLVKAEGAGFEVKVGLYADTGIELAPTQLEAEVLGIGVSFGQVMGVSTPLGGVSVDLVKLYETIKKNH